MNYPQCIVVILLITAAAGCGEAPPDTYEAPVDYSSDFVVSAQQRKLRTMYNDLPLSDTLAELIRAENGTLAVLADAGGVERDREEYQVPELDRLLQRPLTIDTVTIEERIHPAATSGLASCDGERRIINFASERSNFNDLYKYVFFREHEYAHHRLGHVTCPLERKRPPSRLLIATQELAADSLAAATILREAASVGPALLAMVAGSLTAIDRGDRYVPPLRMRGCLLMNAAGLPAGCD